MSLHYFGTDGFRGEANVTLTADQAYKIGRYVGWYYTEGATKQAHICVARDTRQSGVMLQSALVAGLCASGAEVKLLGVLPTPSVSYVVRTCHLDAGVMITASHNPYYDNGIKLVNSCGYKMDESILEQVEAYMDGKSTISFATGEHIGQATCWHEGREAYKQHVMAVAEGLDLSGLKIALDLACGASYEIAPEVFAATGAELVVVGNTPNGTNINVDCGSTHIQHLGAAVREQGCDCGFAFDGDCDRCIAVDGLGREVDGDKILYLCGVDLARQDKLAHNTIVSTVMANIGFDKAVEKAGLKTVHTDVGDKYVFASMLENGYVLGGEQSGHVIFADCEVTGDGMVTALKLLHAVQNAQVSFTECAEQIQQYPQVLVNVRVHDKEQALHNEQVQAAISKAEEALCTNGRILVRPSGTEPLIRILVEANTLELCNEVAQSVADSLTEF